MKKSIIILLFITLLSAQGDRIFQLKSGEQIVGRITAVDSTGNIITVKTAFGLVDIDYNQLKSEVVTIYLKSGDRIKGTIIQEDDSSLKILSQLGTINFSKSEITRIDSGPDKPLDSFLGTTRRFTHGQEQQIDIFYDPTGYTLEQGVLYVSGLSWGFGISERFQITSSWWEYFFGNFNLRPKIQLFKAGSFEKEHAFAIGAHFHTRYLSDHYEWTEETYQAERGVYDDNWIWQPTGQFITTYFGGYERSGSTLSMPDEVIRYDDESGELTNDWVDIEDPERQIYGEAFMAYSFSHTRRGNSGRINHTLGASIGKLANEDEFNYRIYYGGAIDVRKNLIMNYEVFYDPWFVEWWNRGEDIFDFEGTLDTSKPNKPTVSPVHYDLGFIYSVSDWLRFGIHFQPYIFAIYLKF